MRGGTGNERCRTQARDRQRQGGGALPRGAEQHRGGAGAARRHPRQQRRLLPRLGLPQAGPPARAAAPQDLRGRRRHHPHGQDGQPRHHQDLPAGRRQGRRADDGAISRAAGGGSRDDHQCRGLRPGDLRSGAPALADHHRRGHGQHRLRRAARHAAADPDRGHRAAAVRACRDRPLRRRLPVVQRRGGACHRHGGRGLPARRAPLRASRRASTRST